MQPSYEVTVVRPWHWGIAIVSVPGAALPDTLGGAVSVAASALIVQVRHAQDIEIDDVSEDEAWATAVVRVRSLPSMPPAERPVLHEGVLELPTGSLTVGDADGDVTVDGLHPRTAVRVQGHDPDGAGLTEVWVDLAPETPHQGPPSSPPQS